MSDFADPVHLIESLSPERIEARLAELSRESDALRVLLRAARARGRVTCRKAATVPLAESEGSAVNA
jgi:hypothetical protein